MENQIDSSFWIPTDAILEKRLIIVLAKMVRYYFDTSSVEIGVEANQECIEPTLVESESKEIEKALELQSPNRGEEIKQGEKMNHTGHESSLS